MICHYLQNIKYNFGITGFVDYILMFCVQTFFIISGYCLCLNYNQFPTKDSIVKFYIKRLIKILPLFYICCFLSIVIFVLQSFYNDHDSQLNYFTIFLNLSLMFMFFGPEYSIITGGWFIGVLLFLYFIYPIISVLKNEAIYILSVFILLLNSLHGFVDIYPFNNNWSYIVSPYLNTYFFLLGIIICKNLNQKKRNDSLMLVILLFLILVSSFFFEFSDLFKIRFILSLLACILLFYILNNDKFNNKNSMIFSFLGRHSFSIFLIHPFSFLIVLSASKLINMNNFIIILISIILTFIFALIFDRFIAIKHPRQET